MDLAITGINCFEDRMVVKSKLIKLQEVLKERFDQTLLDSIECITETDFPLLKLAIPTEELESLFKIIPPTVD